MAAGIGVGILSIPLVASVSEDALRSVPQALREASYGMGARKITTGVKVRPPGRGLGSGGGLHPGRLPGHRRDDGGVHRRRRRRRLAVQPRPRSSRASTMTAAMASQATGTDAGRRGAHLPEPVLRRAPSCSSSPSPSTSSPTASCARVRQRTEADGRHHPRRHRPRADRAPSAASHRRRHAEVDVSEQRGPVLLFACRWASPSWCSCSVCSESSSAGIAVLLDRGSSVPDGGTRSTRAEAGSSRASSGSFWIGVFVVGARVPGRDRRRDLPRGVRADNRLTRFINVNIRNLAGVPSIVYGILGLTIFVKAIEGGQPGGARSSPAGLTLAILVLPIVIITASEAVRAVPDGLREAGYGVGRHPLGGDPGPRAARTPPRGSSPARSSRSPGPSARRPR